MSLREPCFQCELDIPHVCYHGVPNARWGLHDQTIEALEAANRYLTGKDEPQMKTPTAPTCPHCASRPRIKTGDYVSPTCTASECQEAEYHENRARNKRAPRRRRSPR